MKITLISVDEKISQPIKFMDRLERKMEKTMKIELESQKWSFFVIRSIYNFIGHAIHNFFFFFLVKTKNKVSAFSSWIR